MAERPNDEPSDAVRDGFTVNHHVIDGVAVVAPNREVDMLTAPLLSEAIAAALAGSPRGLIVDLSDVTFFSSAGMTVLVKAKEQVGDAFAVVADGPATSRPLTLVGLDDLLSVRPTLEDALRDLP